MDDVDLLMITLLEKDALPSTVRRLAPNSTAPSAFVRRCYHLSQLITGFFFGCHSMLKYHQPRQLV